MYMGGARVSTYVRTYVHAPAARWLSRSRDHFLGMELSPAFYPSALSRDELIVFYSLRGLPVADIRQLLVDVQGLIRLVYTYIHSYT